MVAVVIHLDACVLAPGRQAELSLGVALLVERLHQQGVPLAVLLQCGAAADVASCMAVVHPAVLAAAAPLSLAQPGQFPVSLRVALDQLSPAPPPAILVLSITDGSADGTGTSGSSGGFSGSRSSSPGLEAAALGCAAELLPARTAAQVEAWGLQAVVSHAVAQAQLALPPQAPPPLVVGYVMRRSRQLDLSRRGMLPLLPTPLHDAAVEATPTGGSPTAVGAAAVGAAGTGSVCFMPLDLDSSLPAQLRRCQLVLHKLTDCLQQQPSGGTGAVGALAPEAAALLALLEGPQPAASQQQSQQQQPAAGAMAPLPPPPPLQRPCLVDPSSALPPVMDRWRMAQALQAAAAAVRRQAIPLRAAATQLLHVCDASATPRYLAAAGVALPCIVKPQCACGVPEAHQMAFVLHSSGFGELEVPLPAVAQEYVDHGGVVWKVYVAGQQVFWAQRRSTPNLWALAQRLADDPDADLPSSIAFDSLNSLPTSLPAWADARAPQAAPPPQQPLLQQQQEGASAALEPASQTPLAPPAPPGHELMRRPTFEAVAGALRQQLGLTLFGFDLVFDSAAGELVVIDVNYFPSYRAVPEAPAALRAALWERHQQHLAAG